LGAETGIDFNIRTGFGQRKITDPFCPIIPLRFYEGPVVKAGWQNTNLKTNQGIL
jgi:hypothetical protein